MRKYISIFFESVGGKWFLLPTATASVVVFTDWLGVRAVIGEGGIPIEWGAGGLILFLWLVGGLLKKTVTLQHRFDLDPSPDASARKAFRRLILDARWGLGRDSADKDFYEDISKELRDKARLGLFKVWAREDGGAFAPPNAIREITPDEWDHLNFCLPSCMGAGPWARLLDYSGERLGLLIDASINQAQLRSVWPAANIFQKLMDRTYGKRQTFYESETKGSEENDN